LQATGIVRTRRLGWKVRQQAVSLALASLSLASFSLASWSLSSPAGAQTLADLPDVGFRPTRGVFVPDASRSGQADATAVELNPGQLGLLKHADVVAIADLWNGRVALPGRGEALMLATPLAGGLGLGAGLQHMSAGNGWRISGTSKFQLGLGLGGRNFGVGATWAHLFGGDVAGTDTFDLGASARLFGVLALGAVVEDVGRPRLSNAAEPLPRRWLGELTVRPLGTDRLELAVAALHRGGDSWSRVGARLRAGLRLGGAWRVFSDVELAPRRGGAGVAENGTDTRATLGFTATFDHASLTMAGRKAFVPDAAPGDGWGGALVIHHMVDRNLPSLSATKVVRLDLDHLESERTFLSSVLRLRALARDPGIAGVVLRIEDLGLGVGRIEELRELVAELRARGKKVIAYVAYPSTRDYYLASACDRVVVHPAGLVTFAGLAQSVTFYKGAMERLGVNLDLVRIAEFKGAMEPFVMTGQSEPVKRNRNELLDDVYARMLAAVEAGRRLPGRAATLVEQGAFTPEEARGANLVDAVRDDHELEDDVRSALGRPGIPIVPAPDASRIRPSRWPGPRLAVILVEGTLVDGGSKQFPFGLGGVAGSDSLVAALEESGRDSSVRAVVLRVNSPGGSAYSSDVVARAVSRVRAQGKPVVVSMGDVAASGGYYIAAPADVIFADPSTTTGSIGIFGFKLDVTGLADALSVKTEVYRRGAHADALSPFRRWTAEERVQTEKKLRHLYDLFLDVVARGRHRNGLTVARVDELGRGRVFTGAQAKAVGLVDELGGIAAAIDRASQLAGLASRANDPEGPELLVLPRPNSSLLRQLAGVSESLGLVDPLTGDEMLPPTVGPALRPVLKLLAPYLFGPGEGVEARLPFEID